MDTLEDRSIEPDVNSSVLQEAASIRQELISPEHLTIFSRELLAPLSNGRCNYISDSSELRFLTYAIT